MRCSLEPGDQVVDQDAEPPLRAGRELSSTRGQVVDAFQVLHHDAHVAQVVAPDLLDQLGVVAAFDIDPAGPGHPGRGRRPGHRAGPARAGPAPARPAPAGSA